MLTWCGWLQTSLSVPWRTTASRAVLLPCLAVIGLTALAVESQALKDWGLSESMLPTMLTARQATYTLAAGRLIYCGVWVFICVPSDG